MHNISPCFLLRSQEFIWISSSFVAAQGYQGTPISGVLRLELKPLFLPWRFLVLPLFRCGGGVERSFCMFCWEMVASAWKTKQTRWHKANGLCAREQELKWSHSPPNMACNQDTCKEMVQGFDWTSKVSKATKQICGSPAQRDQQKQQIVDVTTLVPYELMLWLLCCFFMVAQLVCHFGGRVPISNFNQTRFLSSRNGFQKNSK